MRRPPDSYEKMKEKFYYDMAMMEIKQQKLKEISRDGGATPVDYEDLTASDDDFAEEERQRFKEFLKNRKQDKETNTRLYGESYSKRNEYDDDPYTAA